MGIATTGSCKPNIFLCWQSERTFSELRRSLWCFWSVANFLAVSCLNVIFDLPAFKLPCQRHSQLIFIKFEKYVP